MMDIERLKEELRAIEQSYNFIETIEEWQSDMRNSLALLGSFIEAEIARQSVKSEDVAEAIEYFTKHRKRLMITSTELLNSEQKAEIQAITDKENLAITALQAYQPWIPVSERMPTENDALCQMVFTWSEEKKELEVQHWRHVQYDPDTTHWKPLPEPPKGETP